MQLVAARNIALHPVGHPTCYCQKKSTPLPLLDPFEMFATLPNAPIDFNLWTRRLPMFENIRADYRAHGSDWSAQGFWAMAVYRLGRWRYTVRPPLLRKAFSLLYKVLFKLVQVVAGIEVPCEAKVGKNFIIDHSGGIVVSGYARFGDNCRIRTGVVVGLARVDDPCAPVIGNNVDIGAGAKVLGRIVIGDNVNIGANSVVTRDVPSNSIAVGIPARVIARRSRETAPDVCVEHLGKVDRYEVEAERA
jgi:serine O-acetyltransferase